MKSWNMWIWEHTPPLMDKGNDDGEKMKTSYKADTERDW